MGSVERQLDRRSQRGKDEASFPSKNLPGERGRENLRIGWKATGLTGGPAGGERLKRGQKTSSLAS